MDVQTSRKDFSRRKESSRRARLRALSGNAGRAEDQPGKKNSANERQRDAQQRANQNVFGNTRGFEFWITGDGFRGENQSHGRGRSQEQPGNDQEPPEPANVQSGIFQVLPRFSELI